MKKLFHIKNLFVFLIFIGGAGCMLYPFISNYVFEHRQDSIINTYEREVDQVAQDKINQQFKNADEYNVALFNGHVQLTDPFNKEYIGMDKGDYDNYLSVDNSPIMGYIKIPSIDVNLPIYHGTSVETLEKGIGHLEGSSLPVGGNNTHSVLTGHTGLSTAKLFTDLTQLTEGDTFVLNVIEKNIAYEVDQIKVVEPDELSDLAIVEGEDYCTLLTCTPYGINTQRLLVRGHRIPYTDYKKQSEHIAKKTQSKWMEEYKTAMFISFGAIALIIILYSLFTRRKKHE